MSDDNPKTATSDDNRKTITPTQHFDALSAYAKKISKFPILSSEEEFELAKEWHDKKDPQARKRLLNSHQRLVLKIASGYRGYGLPVSDLVAEGNIGMMQAIKKFDPDKGFRFSTYAMWWIKASVKEYVMRNWSLVRVGTTAAQKKLFFNLKGQAHKHRTEDENNMSSGMVQKIAKELKVTEDEVRSMYERMKGQDSSLNSPITSGGEGDGEWIDWLSADGNHEEKIVHEQFLQKRKDLLEQALSCLNQREHSILLYRRLSEPPHTLEMCSQEIGVSRERIRQIEKKAFQKVQHELRRVAPKDQFGLYHE